MFSATGGVPSGGREVVMGLFTVDKLQAKDTEGLTTAGTRYLISDRDLDALGWAILVWENRERAIALGREGRRAA